MDTYVDTGRFPVLDGVVAEAEDVAELLSVWGGEHRPWQGEDRTSGAVKTRLREWSGARPPRNSMLLWFGHGESNEDTALLAVRGAGIDDQDDSIRPAELGEYLVQQFRSRAREDCWAVVVVEACGAARFIDKLLAYVVEQRAAEHLVIIGSGADQGRGYLASFREVLTTVLEEFSGNYSHIRLRDLAQRIQDLLEPGRVWYQLAGDEVLVRRAEPAEPVIMTLEDYARPRTEAASVTPPDVLPGDSGAGPAVPDTTLAPVRAGSPSGELAWLFVGRSEDRNRIADWLTDADHGVLAVTGPPGCGKSALLGHILLRVARSGEPSGPGPAPRHEPWPDHVPRPAADTFLNLTGASVGQVVEQLAQVFAVPALPEASNDDERIRALLDAVRPGDRRWTLFADALDASNDPNRLADLLRALGALPGVRVVVGTRPSSADSLDMPEAVVEDLLDGLGCVAADILRLTPDPQDLAVYVREALLAEQEAFTDLEIDLDAAIQRVVALVCSAPQPVARRDFLYATLAVHEIMADPTLLAERRRDDLADLLGKDHQRLFAAVVTRLRDALPGSMAVLRALAFAQGHGLPRAERIWTTVASALNGSPVDVALLDAVAKAAAPYIMLDAEDGQAVYRVAHRTFRDFLLGGDDPQETRRREQDRLRIVTALTQLAAARDESRTAVPRPHPYLVRHLTAHAAEAGPEGWRVLAGQLGVLDHLDPAALAGAVLRSGAGLAALPPPVTGALALAHLAAAAAPADRRGLRELGSWRTGAVPAVPTGVPYDGPAASWTVRWATLPPCAPHLTLAGLGVPMRALRVLTRRTDGRKLLIGAGEAGVVRAWDLRTGLETVPALRGGPREGAQFALAPLRGPDGTDRIAAAGVDRALRVWDVLTGRPVGPAYSLLGDAVGAMAPFAGKLAIGDLQGRLWLFDPVEEREERSRTGHHGPVLGMAVFEQPGSGAERLVTVDAKGWALVWRADRSLRETEWRAHDEGARAVTVYTDPKHGVVLTVTGEDGTVRLWDPEGRRELGRLTGHEGPVYAVTAFTDPEDGAMVLATAGQDGTVRLWDPGLRRELGRLTGHEGPVYAVTAFTDPEDGTMVLATAGQDGTVRLWDPYGRSAAARPTAPPVRALTEATDPAHGGVLRVAYADGGVVRLRASDGTVLDAPVPGGDVVSLAALPAPGGGAVLATSHTGGAVRIDGVPAGGRERGAKATSAGQAGTSPGKPLGRTVPPQRFDSPVPPPSDPVRFLAGIYTTEGRPAFAGLTARGELRWWDARTGSLLGSAVTELPAPFMAMNAIPRGAATALAVVGDGGHRVWWSAGPRGPWRPLFPGQAGRFASTAALRGPTEAHLALVTVGREGELRVWDCTGTRLLHTVRLGLRCHALTSLGEGGIAVGTQDGVVVLDLDVSAWADPGEAEGADPGDGAVFGEQADRSSGIT
ncbi:AAA family ATPase [Kitasatospora sp. NRRL B-11411]|uniref:AAA family ATPase n=1 Tax=Kitasatospora sp. NRRL B-11411 TaxID=1463822 RepID=UPI0012FEE71B|nr:AAA family ATPase [Kitasatospora sp. NRRL B-11411]